MKPPVPAKGKPPAPRKEPQPRRDTAASGASAELKVVYPRRMNPQHVYALTVTSTRAARGGAEPVVLRPIIPGALVTPAEQKLDVGRPGDKATFAVTPLARGRYPGPRIEVVQGGKPAQAIPLSMKGSTQRVTRWLLLLAFVVPLTLLYLRANPVQVPKSQDPPPVPASMSKVGEGEQAPKDNEQPKPPPGGPRQMPPGAPGGAGGRPPMQQPGMAPPLPPPPSPTAVKKDLPHTPTEVIIRGTKDTLTTNLPEVPGYSGPAYKAVADGVGWTYGTFIEGSDFRQLPFWSFAVLLLLSFCSWLMHGSYRGSTRKTVELTPRPADTQGIETLPLNPGDGPALGS